MVLKEIEIVAYMISLVGLEYPKYLMHSFVPKVFWDPQIWDI